MCANYVHKPRATCPGLRCALHFIRCYSDCSICIWLVPANQVPADNKHCALYVNFILLRRRICFFWQANSKIMFVYLCVHLCVCVCEFRPVMVMKNLLLMHYEKSQLTRPTRADVSNGRQCFMEIMFPRMSFSRSQWVHLHINCAC